MGSYRSAVLAWTSVVACASMLAACGGVSPKVAQAPVAGQALAARQAPAARVAAPEAVAEPSEAVWHLRAGLNVAALSCRGKDRAAVAPAYSRLLSRHKALLASAYVQEQRRYGSGMDKHLTKLYNRFANQRSPARFCQDAAQVAGQAVAMDSAALSRAAPRLLSSIGG